MGFFAFTENNENLKNFSYFSKIGANKYRQTVADWQV